MGRKPAPKIHLSRSAINRHVGEPPKNCILKDDEISGVYNTMSYHHNLNDAYEFACRYAEKHDTELYAVIQKKTKNDITTIFGWISYFKLNGVTYPQSVEDYFTEKRKELISGYKPDNVIEYDFSTKKQKLSVEDTIALHEIETVIDGYHNFWFRFQSFDFSKFFLEKQVKVWIQQKYLKDAKDNLYELENPDDDDQIEEAYAHMKPQKRNSLIEFYSSMVDAIETNLNIRKQNRKPRKIKKDKTKIVKKMVSMLRFQPNSSELGMNSINIERVIDSEYAVFYDTKYKKLTVLIAEQGKKLAGHRTAIVNFDTTLSYSIALRKPKETLAEINSGNRARVEKIVEKLTTKKNSVETFMTSECRMLIKVG
jgi:hypothetical protein